MKKMSAEKALLLAKYVKKKYVWVKFINLVQGEKEKSWRASLDLNLTTLWDPLKENKHFEW